MALTARYIGLKEVIDCYQSQAEKSGSACFSMWDKSKMICQYNGDDVDDGIDILTDEINRNIRRNYNNVLALYIHPGKETLYTIKSPVFYNCYFKSFQDQPESMPVYPGMMQNDHQSQRINALESRINALMDDDVMDDDDDDDQDDDQMGKYISGINTILAHPVVNLLVSQLITPGQSAQPANNVQALAGINDQDEKKLIQIFSILQSKGVTIGHLQKLAAMDAKQIQQLIKLL